MLLESLRHEVLAANIELSRTGLAAGTFGNASGVDRKQGLVAIKPSGVPYAAMSARDIVVTDLTGRIVDGALRPSSDLATHLVIYNTMSPVGGVVHTHSSYATIWAQSRRPIPCFGTTHADFFYGEIPVTDVMSDEEVAGNYEENTGLVIARRFRDLDPQAMTAVLVANHGPFCWGPSASAAAKTAFFLEEVARMAYLTLALNPASPPIANSLLDRHYLRKHGKNATYGQC